MLTSVTQPVYHMTFLQAIVIGLIQGVTELFPISSLGHTVLIPAWVGGTWETLVRQESSGESPFLAFVVGLHLATALVLLGFYDASGVASSPGSSRRSPVDGSATTTSVWRG